MKTVPFGPRNPPEDPLVARAAELPKEIEPPRDLWPAIAARIAADPAQAPRGLPRWPMALAAGVAIAAVSALLTWGVLRTPGTAPEPAGSPVIARSERAPTPIVSVRYGAHSRLSESELAARDALFAEFRERLDALRPQTRETIARNLAVIQRAVNDIDAALAQDPASGMLNGLLMGAYRQELQLYSMVVTTRGPDTRST